MKTIHIETGKPYDAVIGNGIIDSAGSLIKEKKAVSDKASKAFIVTDSNVDGLYAERLSKSLEDSGFEAVKYVMTAGEAEKNTENLIKLLEFLAENEVTRSDFIVALGGGVIGDLAGFAAAVILRGINCIQVPTTLLALVDSSVGGKTAVDLKAGKNLAGAFHQPSLVICDLDVLKSLPEETFIDGCAEVIKYGILADEELFKHLSENGPGFDREKVISRCIEIKRDVVVGDEFDNGSRQLLNLGHTLAHAAEQKSGYTLSHGKAVAIGMAVFSRAAVYYGICKEDCQKQIEAVISRFGLPTETGYSADELYEVMLKDKKRKGDTISVVLPEKIGRCMIKKISIAELKELLCRGLFVI